MNNEEEFKTYMKNRIVRNFDNLAANEKQLVAQNVGTPYNKIIKKIVGEDIIQMVPSLENAEPSKQGLMKRR